MNGEIETFPFNEAPILSREKILKNKREVEYRLNFRYVS